jgi:hypothetical protein
LITSKQHLWYNKTQHHNCQLPHIMISVV